MAVWCVWFGTKPQNDDWNTDNRVSQKGTWKKSLQFDRISYKCDLMFSHFLWNHSFRHFLADFDLGRYMFSFRKMIDGVEFLAEFGIGTYTNQLKDSRKNGQNFQFTLSLLLWKISWKWSLVKIFVTQFHGKNVDPQNTATVNSENCANYGILAKIAWNQLPYKKLNLTYSTLWPSLNKKVHRNYFSVKSIAQQQLIL